MEQSVFRKRGTLVASAIYQDNTILENLISELEIKAFAVNTSFRKRAFDIFFSFFVIFFIFSWLFPLIALLIKITSKGPVLFVQDRVGLNGNTFKCFKFRTMKVADVKYMYTPTDKSDSRITLIGQFLRKTNLDELPQFFNVLKGDMSIVGPRPHPIAFHNEYATYIDNIDLRHLVKPGITGLAQINGYRGDVLDKDENKKRTAKRIAYDLEYIQNWSFQLDLKIILTTVSQMISNQTNGH